MSEGGVSGYGWSYIASWKLAPFGLGMDHYGYHFGHFFDRILGSFFAEPTVFQSAVGHQVRAPEWSPIDMDVSAAARVARP